MAVHVIAINNRIASIDVDAELVCNNPTDTIQFEFDEEWSAHPTKTVRFSWEGRYIDIVITGNEVKVPEIFRTNYVFIGVYADKITSTPVKMRCKYSIKCIDGAPDAPAPDVYAQILELLNSLNGGGSGSDADYVGIKSIEQTISSTESGGLNRYRITLTDGTGANIDVYNGNAGEAAVGIESITVHDSTVTGGANRVIIALTDGTRTTFNVQNGKDGKDGKDGSSGASGVSPVISVEQIEGGNRVTIIDANGSQSFDVMNGTDSVAGVVEESDPTVPDWAKAASKPNYTAAEVGAIADTSGAIKTNHYTDLSILSTKLADNAIWPRHISEMAWNEVDKHINSAVGEGGGGAGVVFAELTLANNVYSCNMTYAEILAAINTNKLVRLKWQNDSATIRNYDYVGVFGLTSTPYIVFQFQSQTGYGTVFVYQNGDVKHYNGTLVRNNLTINGHALSGNIVLTADDVGALADSDATWAEIDARINSALGVIENGAY